MSKANRCKVKAFVTLGLLAQCGFAMASPSVADKVVLGNWAIGRTEVTIAQFERYVLATGTVTRAEKEGGGFEYGAGWERRPGWSWRRPDGVVPASVDLPAVHLDFAEAQAYCRWVGGRLPTGAEWQKAGFTELRASPPAPWVKGRTYAWTTGDSPIGANTSDSDPWPRAAPGGGDASRGERALRHGGQCLGVDHRCAGQPATHRGGLVVVWPCPNEVGCAGIQACRLLCGVHRVSLCLRPSKPDLTQA